MENTPYSILSLKTRVFIINPLPAVASVLCYGIQPLDINFHRISLKPGVNCIKFCPTWINNKTFHFSIAGLAKGFFLIPLHSNLSNVQGFLVSSYSTPPSLQSFCKAIITQSGASLAQSNTPRSIIASLFCLSPSFVNADLGKANPIYRELRPCAGCRLTLKLSGTLPAH